jgi:hypothetical protein
MKIIIFGLIVLMCFLSVSSAYGAEDVCKKAVSRCAADAVKAGFVSGGQSFLLYMAGCFMGYTWCLKYYDPQY